jgi:UDP-N-acetylmuramate: L-alanyl-gamma-D-glutamyl-meso-diaminopimelate ligase
VDENLERLLEMGCWTPVEKFSVSDSADWTARFDDAVGRRIAVQGPKGRTASGRWHMSGSHNLENALAAVAAAASAGVSLERAVDALSRFEGVKRRMERTATVADIAIFDDFAHHPTAIQKSIEALRQQHPGRRVIVAVEPRSNTMKLGVHNDELAASLQGADLVWMFRPADMGDGFDAALASLGDKLRLFSDYDQLVNDLSTKVASGDRVVFMSNGGFGAARQTLTALLQRMRGS